LQIRLIFLLFILIQTSLSQDLLNPIKEFKEINTTVKELEIDSTLIKVRIWGEIINPGVYIIPKSSSLLDIIAIAGGPKEKANLNNVCIISSTTSQIAGEYKTVNLFSMLKTGKIDKIPKIQNNTIIILEKSGKQKFLKGLTLTSKILNVISIFLFIYYYLK